MTKKSKKRSLTADDMATRLHHALRRDLSDISHVYVSGEHYEKKVSLQLDEFLKKFKFSTTEVDTAQAAYDKFTSVNDHMARVQFKLTDHPYCQSTMSEFDSITHRAKRLIHTVLGRLDEDEWFRACKHGPGTTQGISFTDCSVYAKSSFPLTVTSRAKPLFMQYMLHDFELCRAIDDFNGYRPYDEWYSIEEGSRATTVPKNNKTDRMIAVEPTCNMFLQQGLMCVMYDRLSSFGLDVERLPDEHRELARESSLTGSLATIDWSSASDCIHPDVVKFLLPPDWYWAVDIVRCQSMKIGDTYHSLNMFSTMGNAVTFPLETLIFWALAEATVLHQTGRNTVWITPEERTCSVFGDDCIVPSGSASAFIAVAERLGFLVNNEKSFLEGPFRESCGGDYHRGYDVRPYHFSALDNTSRGHLVGRLYVAWNTLTMKYIEYFGSIAYVYDKAVFRAIAKMLRLLGEKVKFVPDFYPDDSGICTSDLVRIRREYFSRNAVSTVSRSVHGTWSFQFHRFKYWDDSERGDWLAYAFHLRRSARQVRQPRGYRVGASSCILSAIRGQVHKAGDPFSTRYETRKRGSYVVANARTAHWSPSIPKYPTNGLLI